MDELRVWGSGLKDADYVLHACFFLFSTGLSRRLPWSLGERRGEACKPFGEADRWEGPCSIHSRRSGGSETKQLAIYTYICIWQRCVFGRASCWRWNMLLLLLSLLSITRAVAAAGHQSLSDYDVPVSTTYSLCWILESAVVSHHAIRTYSATYWRYDVPEMLLLFSRAVNEQGGQSNGGGLPDLSSHPRLLIRPVVGAIASASLLHRASAEGLQWAGPLDESRRLAFGALHEPLTHVYGSCSGSLSAPNRRRLQASSPACRSPLVCSLSYANTCMHSIKTMY